MFAAAPAHRASMEQVGHHTCTLRCPDRLQGLLALRARHDWMRDSVRLRSLYSSSEMLPCGAEPRLSDNFPESPQYR